MGIREILYQVGTCPRNCKTCLGADSCIECAANYKLEDSVCVCDESVSSATHYGCISHCDSNEILVSPSLDRCVLCERFIPYC